MTAARSFFRLPLVPTCASLLMFLHLLCVSALHRLESLHVLEHPLEKAFELPDFGLRESMEDLVGEAHGDRQRLRVELPALRRELELDRAAVFRCANAAHEAALL